MEIRCGSYDGTLKSVESFAIRSTLEKIVASPYAATTCDYASFVDKPLWIQLKERLHGMNGAKPLSYSEAAKIGAINKSTISRIITTEAKNAFNQHQRIQRGLLEILGESARPVIVSPDWRAPSRGGGMGSMVNRGGGAKNVAKKRKRGAKRATVHHEGGRP